VQGRRGLSDDPGDRCSDSPRRRHSEQEFGGGEAGIHDSDEEYPMILTTGRQLFHSNVGTMSRRTDLPKLTRA
jgi:anaerobic selenocysteine-containing dehydrogenase